MKNFKIVMILVAAVAMFCSCGGDPEAPVVALTDSTSATETTFDLANPSLTVTLGLATSDEKGLKSIELTRTSYDANGESLGKPVEFPIPAADYEGMTDYSGAVLDTLTKTDVEGATKVVYEVVVTNKKDAQAKATYTVNVVAPSFTMNEGTFEWFRQGNTKTGFDQFGLQFENATKSIMANIKPLTDAKLYILEPADYAITNINDLNAKLTAEATVYRNIITDNSGTVTYDDVIATVYNGKTHLLHITSATTVPYNETTNPGGAKVTITGTYKTFESTPVAAK